MNEVHVLQVILFTYYVKSHLTAYRVKHIV